MIESHGIARAAFVSALGFALVALGWAVHVLVRGGSWWGPLHSFLAGTVLLAISGASQMFTITWSSTVPPARIVVGVQRWLLISGVGAVLGGVALGSRNLVWFGGAAVVGGLVLLGFIISSSVRKSLLRRFDLSARFYLAAFAAGILGISLGTVIGAGVSTSSPLTVRLVHAHLNLVGLVGLTIIGTIPTLLPTTAYNRSVSGREALLAWRGSLLGIIAIAMGLLEPRLVGVGTLLIAASGGLILGGILWRLGTKGRRKPAFLEITIGTVWLVGWGLFEGWHVMVGGSMLHFSGWTAAVVLAGVGQVLAGSLTYLLPVLQGPPFDARRRIMERRPWLPLLVLNAAGFGLGFEVGFVVVILVSMWLGDFGIRLIGLARESPGR